MTVAERRNEPGNPRQDLAEILAAAGILHRRRSFTLERIGNVEHVVDRFLDGADAPGLPLAEDARLEIAGRRLATDIGDLVDGNRRAVLAPDGIAGERDRRAERSGTRDTGYAEQRENERNDGKTTRERGRSLRLRERAQIHRNRHPVA
ncbi:hypothetical protein ACVWYQ_007502 [Bradyrhizobium sp. USDA 3397]